MRTYEQEINEGSQVTIERKVSPSDPSTARPILFSGPMVRAILEGKKVQTRRVINPQPVQNHSALGNGIWEWYFKDGCTIWANAGEDAQEKIVPLCPYGKPGDLLWVRETWRENEEHEGGFEAQYNSHTVPYFYAANYLCPEDIGPWRPSIHMPRRACRLRLRIKEVRVERLQDISPADALAEGFPFHPLDPHALAALDTVDWYTALWDSINAKKHPWASNPWVWVVTFEKVNTPDGNIN